MDCRSCASGLDHCHGTLVLHESGVVDCTEACSDLDQVRHSLRMTCAEIEGGCRCVAEFTEEFARAS
ncbi:MAG TPA: hypothetical protein VJT49_19690 [Amycolatopsis sp.]|uniref:hypothetical protein n=1 Tax=Amycolatopsis sp. TaxID=37632 RepID=UPI002B47376A|nr:hypothetical protein [Amycolatopsis sp.]HKS47289.1 hypothetical protein [Amycolatopsis sp.]